MSRLNGKHVAFLLTDGYEDSELTQPWEALTEAGAKVTLIAPQGGEVEGKKGFQAPVDLTSAEVDAKDYDALMLPGGVINADHLRMDQPSVAFTRAFFDAGKPVGVICHGGWILTDADVVRDRTLTSYPSLKTDLVNAGATWVDEEVVVDGKLVSSRTPADLPAFNAKLIEAVDRG